MLKLSSSAPVFLGATPELLARVAGRSVVAQALAGSAGRGRTAGEDERVRRALLASAKERSEHELVVAAVREALAPVCDEVAAPERPHALCLSGVQHLETRVRARLGVTLQENALIEPLSPIENLRVFARYHLLSRSGNLTGIRKIVSHPQALAQCRRWLEENLPDVPQFDVASTAQAAARSDRRHERAGSATDRAPPAAPGPRARSAPPRSAPAGSRRPRACARCAADPDA